MKKKVKNLKKGKFEVLNSLHLSKIKGGSPTAPDEPTRPEGGKY